MISSDLAVDFSEEEGQVKEKRQGEH